MTELIEPYSGYILAWVLVGLLFVVMHAVICIKEDSSCSNISFAVYMSIFFFFPIILAYFSIKRVMEVVLDASKAFKRFGRFKSGSEELVLVLFYMYTCFAVLMSDMDKTSKLMGVIVFAYTALLLCQSARAIQVKDKEANWVNTYDPHPVDELDALLNVLTNSPQARSRKLEYMHQEHLEDIREQAEGIRKFNNTNWDFAIAKQRWQHNPRNFQFRI
ncbi:hypothetical protein [Vreelandella venusta]|uniref:hypothetical protein n=1 Tax=Vreelandella venusta TaxID=44935 RepID=UPI00116E1673|nr:hypothetical protein [Halomonas venusta]GEK52388.1 hypothetical protein HVE01_31090 [Halomonas venusta]